MKDNCLAKTPIPQDEDDEDMREEAKSEDSDEREEINEEEEEEKRQIQDVI